MFNAQLQFVLQIKQSLSLKDYIFCFFYGSYLKRWPGLKNVKRDEGRKPATLAARRESDPKIACGVLLIKCRSREESTCLKG